MDCDAYRDRMLDVLYGEADEASRAAVEAHQAACADCREEHGALRRLRRDLAQWTLPPQARPRAPRRPAAPALALAASALLALAGALAVAGVELRRHDGGVTVRVGRPAAGFDLQARLDAQEARHRREIAELRASLAAAPARDSGAVLQAARDLVQQSEQRQQARLMAALAELADRAESQRRYDLAQVSAGLAYLDGKAGLHAARNTELMGQLLLASQEK